MSNQVVYCQSCGFVAFTRDSAIQHAVSCGPMVIMGRHGREKPLKLVRDSSTNQYAHGRARVELTKDPTPEEIAAMCEEIRAKRDAKLRSR